ncbi:copper chaperone PCu(A)C [Xanthomonas sp. LF06-19]|uniref:copper chaperone PCu(A)C n=1 Tax=Xanthomonas sp. LF06-19 TaxID=3097551 RepID=UPI0025FCB8D2|nr:copper chaperone PCu(A)C [Xanthomonas sp. LF06-19]MDY4281954.1 copper chaperone PCu(A)C [Xanthomonas sp. LF06-19]
MKLKLSLYAWRLAAGLTVLLPLVPVTALAAPSVKPGSCLPIWRDGWIRLPPNAAMSMAAGFGRLYNPCGQAFAVVSVRSPVFAEVSLHQTTVIHGISKMREVERLSLAAGATAVLEPGGLHLMFMQSVQPLHVGTSMPIIFVLDDGREVQGKSIIRTSETK